MESKHWSEVLRAVLIGESGESPTGGERRLGESRVSGFDRGKSELRGDEILPVSLKASIKFVD
jgi:hypothetical protein